MWILLQLLLCSLLCLCPGEWTHSPLSLPHSSPTELCFFITRSILPQQHDSFFLPPFSGTFMVLCSCFAQVLVMYDAIQACWAPLPPFFRRRDTFVSSPLYPAVLFLAFLSRLPAQPTRTCVQTGLINVFTLLFLGRMNLDTFQCCNVFSNSNSGTLMLCCTL